MKRLNLDLTPNDVAELRKAKDLLEAMSITETIRRSVRFTNRLLEHRGKCGQIIIERKSSRQSIAIIA